MSTWRRWRCRRGHHRWGGPPWLLRCLHCHLAGVDAFLADLTRRHPEFAHQLRDPR